MLVAQSATTMRRVDNFPVPSVPPLNRQHRLPFRVALPAPEPGREIDDPIIRREPEPLRECGGRDQLIVPACALDPHEIAGSQVGDASCVERDHRRLVPGLFSHTTICRGESSTAFWRPIFSGMNMKNAVTVAKQYICEMFATDAPQDIR